MQYFEREKKYFDPNQIKVVMKAAKAADEITKATFSERFSITIKVCFQKNSALQKKSRICSLIIRLQSSVASSITTLFTNQCLLK